MPMLMHGVKETVGKQAKAKSVSKLSHLKVQTHVLPQLKRGCQFPGGLLPGDSSNQATSQFPALCPKHGPTHSSSQQLLIIARLAVLNHAYMHGLGIHQARLVALP